MTFIIKFSLSTLLTAFLVSACSSTSTEPDGTPAGTTKTSAYIDLTDEQMQLAGIQLGQPEARSMSEYVDCTGKVEVPPESLFSVYSPTNGFVESVSLLPGDYIKKGSLLTAIRHPDLARIQREFLEVYSQLDFLEEEYRRQDTLATEAAASRKALGQARADHQLALARYRGLKAELGLIGVNTAALEAGGDIQSSISLSAPRNGYITQVNINPGKLISPGDLLFEIVDNSHLHLELQIFAKDLESVRKGQRIECNLPGNDQMFTAQVHLIGKMIDPETKTTRVHGHFEKEPIELTPGTYVQARIHTDEQQVMTLPQEAIVREGDRTFVFVKKEEGFQKMPVQTGRSDAGYTEVSGLEMSEGEMLAVGGAYYIQGMDQGG